MPTLREVASYVRSKNAGPFWLTIDIFCPTEAAYRQVCAAASLTARALAELYGADPEHIKRFELSELWVLKLSLPRPQVQGSLSDRDMHAGQQYVRLLGLKL